MPRYAAFLRGINVGGRRLTNEKLAGCFERIGLDEVATFRASGNVVFTAAEGDPAELTARIEHGLARSLGYEVAAFLRTEAQVRAIARHQPFDAALVAASKGKLQVGLLSGKPTTSARRSALAHASGEDRLAIRAAELYWLPAGGMSDSELDLDELARILGPTTIRTKGTIEQIATKHFAA